MRRPNRSLVLPILAVLALTGCVIARNPSYPQEWAAPDKQRIGTCPAIAGVYSGLGWMGLESGVECSSPRTAKVGAWQCTTDLAVNLGLPASFDFPVELRQPDDATLDVTVHTGGKATTTVLKEGKDFSCNADSLYFTGTENAFGSKAMTVVGLVVLTGGIENHTRSFARAESGDLVMTVRGRFLFFYIGLPIAFSGTTHVRWTPTALPAGGPQ